MAKIYVDLIRKGKKTLKDVPAKLRAEVKALLDATLIIKGKKTFADVPDKIKAQVKETLEALDCGELAQ